MRRLAVLGALGLLLAGITPAGAAKDVAFPDGEWSGTAIWTGSISKQDVFASGNGKVAFSLAVDGGDVVAGELTMNGTGQSKVPGGTGKLKLVASLSLGGTAAKVTANGTLDYRGTVTVAGFGAVPVSGTAAGSTGTFSPTFVSCNKVTGDLATQGRKVQQAAGFTTTVAAKFVAVRTGGSPAAQGLVEDYKGLVEAVLNLLTGGPVDIAVLLDVAHEIDALNAAFLGLGGCDVPPAGFTKGLQDTLLTALFQDLLSEKVLPGDAYTAQELLAFLGVGVHVGAVGGSVPGNLGQTAKTLLVEFEAALDVKLAQAIGEGNVPTIIDILIGGQQFGLDSLAAKAQGALATVGGP